MKLKKGDNVIVVAGKDKGKEGKVVKTLRDRDMVIVEAINMRSRHQRPRATNQKGQIVSFAAPLHVSNVMLKDPKTGKPTRVRMEQKGDKKVRVAVKSGAQV